MKKACFALLIILMSQIGMSQTTILNTSYVQFFIGNMGGMRTVEGTIKGMSGDIEIAEHSGEITSLEVCLESKTIDTDNNMRDKHLKGEDFFEVEKFPTICFKSTQVKYTQEQVSTTGILTIHGVSKEVTIPLTVSKEKIEGKLSLERLDYKIGPKGGFMVSKDLEVDIFCLIKQ